MAVSFSCSSTCTLATGIPRESFTSRLIVMRFVDHYWQVAPEYHDTLSVSVIDVALPIAIGGIFLTLYAMRLKSQPLMPLHDTGLEKALTHHVH